MIYTCTQAKEDQLEIMKEGEDIAFRASDGFDATDIWLSKEDVKRLIEDLKGMI